MKTSSICYFRRMVKTDVSVSHSHRYFSHNKQKNKDVSSIMTTEILHIFNSKNPNGVFLDASFGEGGHSINLIKSSHNNHIIALDCDHTISKKTANYLQHKYRESQRFKFIHSKWCNMFANMTEKLPEISETNAFLDGILLETGTALIHEKIRHRGLIFDTKSSNLDMRYCTTSPKRESLAVRDLINHKQMTVELLADILSIFGDQSIDISTAIAQAILSSGQEVSHMEDIVSIVSKALSQRNEYCEFPNPMFLFNKRKTALIRNDHPIKKTLYGLIRFINNTFIELSMALRQGEVLLKRNGVFIIICYDQLESRVIADFLKSRKLLNLEHDNDIESAIVYVDREKEETVDSSLVIADDTMFLKQRNERLDDGDDWHGIGAARFNDFNAVPFIQPHIAEISSHPRGKYGRMLILERTGLKSNEDVNVFMESEKRLETQTLTCDNIVDVIRARNESTRKLLECPSHNCFMR
eukprot:489593_1